ncbi:LD-carboxypeptidase [Bacteroidetes/Chlorobi group bacterium ChocPot_Mid]|jgi:muramoyltetrapeptide carboxypeptidase|nr:MAG: LD-carboxypeptidase [Bacteroidetes/Chlorobi group bacterium ChocPot_Mid]
MDKERRKILSSLMAVSFGAVMLPVAGKLKANDKKDSSNKMFLQDELFYNHFSLGTNPKPVLPKGLKPGSKMAVIAPASHAAIWELRNLMTAMKQLGIELEIGETIKNYKVDYRYFSAPDEVRSKELMNYFERNDIDAIMTVRGGYGVMRILDMLDFDVISQNPKIIIGFSDITALLNAVYKKSNIVTFHGPVGVSSFNTFSINSFKDVLFSNGNFKPLVYKDSNIKMLFPGKATGRLVGGNLTMLSSTLGSPYEIDTEGALLFFEEVSEDPYKLDRMLTQLEISNKLDKCVGIMFGSYPTLDKKYYFYPNLSYTAREVIESRLKKFKIPAVIGIPVGHLASQWTLPIGVKAELDANKGILTILEPAVS